LKIIHIHTDLKFLYDSNRFENKNFENIIIIIGNKGNYEGEFSGSALFFKFSAKNLRNIIAICKLADMVVLYDLNFPKAYIANRLPKSVIIVWRFFGLELYGQMPDFVFSDQTLKASKEMSVNYNYLYFKNLLVQNLNKLRFSTNLKMEFEKAAFHRVDYFHGLSKNEYDFLKDFWPHLPAFLQIDYSFLNINYLAVSKADSFQKGENNLIIIGNNRSAYNNHLDVINFIEKSNAKKKYKFLMFFNYGQDNAYTQAVRSKAAATLEITLLEDFLERDKFNQIYSDASALVINGHRQMAMGNIFEALKNNTKIYLNIKNIILDWLKEEGFCVFSIEDFAADLENNNIALNKHEASRNQNNLISFTGKYSKNAFQEKLIIILNKTSK